MSHPLFNGVMLCLESSEDVPNAGTAPSSYKYCQETVQSIVPLTDMYLQDLTALVATLSTTKYAPYDSGFDIYSVVNKSIHLAAHSWEYGAASIALLEMFSPTRSEFATSPFPPPSNFKPTKHPATVSGLVWITLGDAPNSLSNGDGAAGDPASLGPVAYLLGQSMPDYAAHAIEELDYLLTGAPRWTDTPGKGAISQRVDVRELWADFMFMVPPYLAFHAASTYNATLLRQAFVQCRRYRAVLQPDSGGGAWQHIVGPQSADAGLWSTGNAWAAQGMARVLASSMHAPFDQDKEAIESLTGYVKEIIDAAMESSLDNGLVRNYLTGSPAWFGETSGSALLTATTYRMAVLRPDVFGSKYRKWAGSMRHTLARSVASDGIVGPSVNPLNWFDRTPVMTGSPEGQSFMVMMYAAWRDCVSADICQKP